MSKLSASDIIYDLVTLYPGLLTDEEVNGADLVGDLSYLLSKYKGLKFLPKEDSEP